MMTGSELMRYLRERMSPTTYYQPLIIAELIRRGGCASQKELAIALMLGDEGEVRRWEKIVARWPRRTLKKHGIVSYDSTTKQYRLLLDPIDETTRAALLKECAAQVHRWQTSTKYRSSSQRYEELRRAAGRCQLCGVPGNITPLHVDHVVPWSKRNRRNNSIITSQGQVVDVDDDRNLQVLCSTCNTAKRASDATDFRPSPQRLAEVLNAVRDLALAQGVGAEELDDLAARVASGSP